MKADVLEQPETVQNRFDVNAVKSKLRAVVSSELLAWIALTFVFAALPLSNIRYNQLADPDIWWHMRAGEWMVQNHSIPHTDPFSASTLGRPWVDYCWMFDVGSYWIVKHFDLASILWFETLMRLAVTALLFSLIRTLSPSFWKAAALTGTGMMAMLWILPPRPGAISVLLFLAELHILVSARRKANPRLLWIIPALFLVWANIHIEFVTGLFLLGVICMEPLMDKAIEIAGGPRYPTDAMQRQLWYVLGASLLATLVNPYGFKLYSNVFQYARDTKIYDIIVEFHAMHFRTPNDWAVLLLLMLGCFALGRMRRLRPAWVVLLGWSAWMGFRSLREVWLVTILSIVMIASPRSEEDQTLEKPVRTSLSMRLAVAVAVALILLGGAVTWSANSQRMLRQAAERFPLGAVNYIHQNHLQGPLLNELSWGGFLIYALPEIPVAMDGRTNVHSQDEIVRALPLWNGEAGWQNRPELERANLVISNPAWPLAFLLRTDPRFRLIYEDKTAVLFQAVHGDHR
ncbi:MAG TPA: hypothetical protein VGS05_07695 [Candidatus Sulfotelmatobacter sp.]|nr:hypothetical protein [Candidatus Sulfotelmatobacter sp.]